MTALKGATSLDLDVSETWKRLSNEKKKTGRTPSTSRIDKPEHRLSIA